ncbi:MAG: phosphotransferase, partial [Planctomycetota bacterium]
MSTSEGAAAVRALLLREYGIDGELVQYPGEEASNVAVRTQQGTFLWKLLPASSPHALAELQAAAFEHVAARARGVAIPRLVRTVRSERTVIQTCADGDRRGLLTTFLPGRALADTAPVRPSLLRSVGKQLAALDRALLDFAHPGDERALRWDLLQASWIGDELAAIEDPQRRQLVASVHARFQERFAEPLSRARRSVIHGDANDQNVLVARGEDGESAVSGIIDFGDMCRSALVGDVAIAATYASLRSDDLLEAIATVTAGFHEVLPLDENELGLVLPCVLLRLAVSVTTAACRRRDGTADAYALANEQEAWAMLTRLAALDVRAGEAAIRTACGLVARPRTVALLASLRSRSGTFAPVLGDAFAPASTPTRVLDLSFASVLAGDDPETFDPEVCSARITAELAQHRAVLGIGRYAEPRTIYGGPAFAGPTPHHERRTMHLGIDLFAPCGTKVHAPLDGEVAHTEITTGRFDYGGMVVLRHRDEGGQVFGTLYGHLDPDSVRALEPGTKIARGEAFAELGDRTGNGDWPEHLHFQLLAF